MHIMNKFKKNRYENATVVITDSVPSIFHSTGTAIVDIRMYHVPVENQAFLGEIYIVCQIPCVCPFIDFEVCLNTQVSQC